MASKLTQQEAHAILVRWLSLANRNHVGQHGYDLYLPLLASKELGNPGYQELEDYSRLNMGTLATAAWELCRRGFLRPSVNTGSTQGNDNGLGFSLTTTGDHWLEDVTKEPFLATEPSKLGEMLAVYRSRFGDGFQQRAQEAVRCYQSHAFLACCAMCGAGAEAVLLAAAFQKRDRDKVLKEYNSASGRRRLETSIFGASTDFIKSQATAGLSLLKYWRDDAAHGDYCVIGEATAFISLLLLLRLSALVDDNWSELTQTQ